MTARRVRPALLVVGAILAGSSIRGGDAATADPTALVERVERLERELDRAQREASVERGARLFARACAACHGRNGRGDGPAASDLHPPPRDLSARQIRFRTTATGQAPRPEDLQRTLRNGLPGTAMPAFGDLFSDREVAELIGFIDSLRPDAGPGTTLPQPLTIPTVAPAGSSTLEEGRSLYLLLGCWRCHGVNGAGRGPSAATLTDDDGRPIRTTDLRHDPFKGGRDAQAVVRTLLTGLNGSPMPDYGEAMLIGADGDPGDLPTTEQLGDGDAAALERFFGASPTRKALDAMTQDERTELRDRRLSALAHYVLSLDRRRGAGHWLLRAQPEREARRP